MIIEIGFQVFIIALTISINCFVFRNLLKEFYTGKDWFGVGLVSTGILVSLGLMIISINLLWEAVSQILY